MTNSKAVAIDSLSIRDARTEDIAEIAALVDACAPYLSKHGPYLYLIYTRCFGRTCPVAVLNESIVGWCSVFRVTSRSYFLHQLGVLPPARGKGVAFCLFTSLLTKLRARHTGDFRVEFTTDRKNHAAQELNRKVAESIGMRLRKLPEAVPPLEDGSEEELYEMTPAAWDSEG